MSSTLPTVTPVAPIKVSIGRSIALSFAVIAALPVSLAVLWLLGLGSSKVSGLIDRVGVSWGQVGIGAAVVAVYVAILAVVHTIRRAAARRAELDAQYAAVLGTK